MMNVKPASESKERAAALELIADCLRLNNIGVRIGIDAMLSIVLWALFRKNDKETVKLVMLDAVDSYAEKMDGEH